jgi:hypothetical protein
MPDARAEMAQTLATQYGLPIIFLRDGDKRPKHTGAFEAQATLDPERIQRELGGASGANYGIAWGPGANAFALDVDDGGDLTIAGLTFELGPLPVTWRIRTQSGNHQDIFRWPADGLPIRNRGRFAPGLDVRGQGGQSVGPGSEFHDRNTGEVRTWSWEPRRAPWEIDLAEMPSAWLALIRAQAERPQPTVAKPTPPQARNRLQAYGLSILEAKLSALRSAPDGQQEMMLGAAALKAGSLVARGWVERSYAEQAIIATLLTCPNYDPGFPWTYADAVYKVTRAIDRGLGSPEPDPAWVAELEARERPAAERPPRDHLTAIAGGKADGSPEGDTGYNEPASEPPLLKPYIWKWPEDIPTRQWLYGRHYIRGYVSCTIGAPGTGKSMLALQEAIAMASGQPILGQACARRKVGYWNGEDPAHELELRTAAVAKHYHLTAEDLEGWLFVGSGRDARITLGLTANGSPYVDTRVLNGLIAVIRELGLDVLIVDPFVSSHRMPENDNMAIDLVVKAWAYVAEVCNIAIEIVHHPRKTNGEALTLDDSRGGGALPAAARVVRLLNRMTEDEARASGVVVDHRFAYFRIDHGKANLAPASKAAWMRFISVDLENGPPEEGLGDNVGVITPWSWPNALSGLTAADVLRVQRLIAEPGRAWREDIRATDWAGHAVAQALGLDLDDPAERARVKTLLKTWLGSGLLDIDAQVDANRKERKYVVVGRWIDPT